MMNKYKNILEIKDLYDNGTNILRHLKSKNGSETNSTDDILISYDLQSGTYLKGLSKDIEFRNRYCKSLARKISDLGQFDSILEVGTGEGITLGKLIQNFEKRPKKIYALDISLSRLIFAQHYFSDISLDNISLFTADLFNIPLPDNSIDIVFTSHAIEPNGGNEKAALTELYRIAKKFVVLLEPSYENASIEGQERMDRHGYIKNLPGYAKELNQKVIYNELFEVNYNPLNPSGLTIIEKNTDDVNQADFICPNTGQILINYNENLLYSPKGYLAYSVIKSIPCLLKENAILSYHLMTDFQKFKKDNNLKY